jgi:hypothetical protein
MISSHTKMDGRGTSKILTNQEMFQTQKFTTSSSQQFGNSLILTNNSLFISENSWWLSYKNVYAYSRSDGSWSNTAVLTPQGSYPLLAATDDMIVSSSSSGTYIFTKSGAAWSTTATLSGEADAASISRSSSLLVAPVNTPGFGRVFEQISSAWTQIAALVPSVTLSSQSNCNIGISEDAKVAGLCGSGMNE